MEGKDPAFLFYSNDFYSGTRTMLPEERACYIDLLIYQHQNGFVPFDLKRVLLFCSGVDKATLEATLEAKFERREKGWVNVKLEKVVRERQEYKDHQSVNGVIGVIYKKIKSRFGPFKYKEVKELANKIGKEKFYEIIINNNSDPLRVVQATLKGSDKHLEIEDEDVIENKKMNNGELKKKILADQTYCDALKQLHGFKNSDKDDERLFEKMLGDFILGKKALGKDNWKDYNSFRTNFFNWVPKRILNYKPENEKYGAYTAYEYQKLLNDPHTIKKDVAGKMELALDKQGRVQYSNATPKEKPDKGIITDPQMKKHFENLVNENQ